MRSVARWMRGSWRRAALRARPCVGRSDRFRPQPRRAARCVGRVLHQSKRQDSRPTIVACAYRRGDSGCANTLRRRALPTGTTRHHRIACIALRAVSRRRSVRPSRELGATATKTRRAFPDVAPSGVRLSTDALGALWTIYREFSEGNRRGNRTLPDVAGCRVGGRGGIRTHESLARLPDFKSGAFNRSATHPAIATQPPAGALIPPGGAPILACASPGPTNSPRSPID